jgi:peptidoglycan hydrolase CwlO-like protein
MMKNQIYLVLSVAGLLLIYLVQPAKAGIPEQLVQLQTTVQMLHDKMDRIDERVGALKDLVSQQTDNIKTMNLTIQSMQKALGQQNTDAASKVDKLTGQVQALRASVDELRARLANVGK